MNKNWIALIGISLASFLGCIDFTIVNTAIPSIQASTGASVTELQWIVNIFVLALCAFMVVFGRLADIHGRRKLLYIGMSSFALASLGAGLTVNIHWLIVFRLLQGMATAILYTATGAVVSNMFPENQKGRALGMLLAANGIGLAIGPVVGGFIISALSWHWVFLVNVPLIVVSFIFCVPTVTESRNTEASTKIDWWGVILLTATITTIILTVLQGQNWGWSSTAVICLFAIGIISATLLVLVENKAQEPIIKFSLFVNRQFIASAAATAGLGFFYVLAFFLMPLYLHYLRGYSGYIIGLALLPTTAMVAILSPAVGQIVDRYGAKMLLIAGLLLLTASALLQAQFGLHTSLTFVIIAFLAMGIGWAGILGPATTAALSSVPESVGGVAMGSAWTLHNVGGALGIAIGTAIYEIGNKLSLVKQLTLTHRSSALMQMVSDPSVTVHMLQKHFHLTLQQATKVFYTGFMQGYNMAFYLLAAISLLFAMLVTFTMRSKKSQACYQSTLQDSAGIVTEP